jgi:iron complex transport system ATP-binding protein
VVLAVRLEANDLAFGYPGLLVGSGVSLALESGEVLCLLGPNGGGKTTLFKTLLGLIPKKGGSVRLDGDPLEGLARREVARRMAYVPQAHAPPFPYSVSEVVLMGRTARLEAVYGVPVAVERLSDGQTVCVPRLGGRGQAAPGRRSSRDDERPDP